ncbi:MAG TPA: hypothetical protein VL086_09155 [Candidatus Nitrosotalea sp.]|nr:hypothetical protein [Candidatus Nitrosotalea sp.]
MRSAAKSRRRAAGMTLRAYARHRRAKGLPGGSLEAVRKALRRGWIQAEPDGRIEPSRADRYWAALTVERVSIYRPGTRRLKSEPGDRPGATGKTTAARGQGERPRRAPAWKPSEAQVQRWTKVLAQLRIIDGRLASATLSPHVPRVTYPERLFWFFLNPRPDWAQQEPARYALLLAEEHLQLAHFELSRVLGRPPACPGDQEER